MKEAQYQTRSEAKKLHAIKELIRLRRGAARRGCGKRRGRYEIARADDGEHMPIEEQEKKVRTIVEIISDAQTVKTFTDKFGGGPTLYFYRKLLNARHHARDIVDFLNDQSNLQLCYCVLGLWGMNTRRARLKSFEAFCQAIEKARGNLIALELAFEQGNHEQGQALGNAYEALDVMETNCKLIANAKLGHFFFPQWLMPADGENTQRFLYGEDNQGNARVSDSKKRYREINDFSFTVRSTLDETRLAELLDEGWNATIPKVIDNAIFYAVEIGKHK